MQKAVKQNGVAKKENATIKKKFKTN